MLFCWGKKRCPKCFKYEYEIYTTLCEEIMDKKMPCVIFDNGNQSIL